MIKQIYFCKNFYMFHPLKVGAIRPLTADAKAITFEVPYELRDSFAFKAGQYVTIEIEIDGEYVRRPYSISSSTRSEHITVGVKQVPEGRFTTYILNELREGMTLNVSEPEGRFVYESPGNPENVLLIAAGSGITPVLSITDEVLRSTVGNRCLLIYGNRRPEETMFSQDLQAYSEEFPDRFQLRPVYSRATVEGADYGRIDQGILLKNLHNFAALEDIDRVYICGPQEMIERIKEVLVKKGMPEDRLFFELFTPPKTVEEPKPVATAGTTEATVILDGISHRINFPTGSFLLDEVLKAGLDAPYSCQGGICSSCVAKISDGQATMIKNQILTDQEVEEGLILTCQARCDSERITIDYDDV